MCFVGSFRLFLGSFRFRYILCYLWDYCIGKWRIGEEVRLFCQDPVAQRNGPVVQRVCSFAQRVITGRPARRRFSEVIIVSKSYTKLCAGVWERDRTRKETKKRHSRARRLHNNSSIPSNSSILCSRCLGVTKLLLHWGWV